MAHEPTPTEQALVASVEPSEVNAVPTPAVVPQEIPQEHVAEHSHESASAPVVVPAEPVSHPTPVVEPVHVEPVQAHPESVQQPHVPEPVAAHIQQQELPPVQSVQPEPVQPIVEAQPIVQQPEQQIQPVQPVQPVVESQPVVQQPIHTEPVQQIQPAQPIVEAQPIVQPIVQPVQPIVEAQPIVQQPIQQAQAVVPSSSSAFQPHSKLYCTPDAERPVELAASGFGTKQPTTVIEVFKATATKYTESKALCVKRDGVWKEWNWGQFYNDAVQFARALLHIKFQPTQTVSILGFNSPEWFIADIGAIAVGGLAAGIYTTNGPEACAYIVGHSKSTVVVVENELQLKKILQVREKLPSVQAIVQWSGVVPADAPGFIYSWEAFLALGNNVNVAEVDARIAELKPGRACTLIYTSGTTGPPKAVMLSHDNLTYNAAAAATVAKLDHNDVIVSYLPLSHIAAQIVDIHGNIAIGGQVWFAQPDALKGSLGETLKEVRPTLFFGVPRVWEKIQEKMVSVGRNNGTLKKKIATWAKGVGLKGGKARQSKHGMPFGWNVANKLVFNKVKEALGLDRARYLATAAAPMPEETAEYFLSLNINICDVYGMSEVSGPTTLTPVEAFRPGSIGLPVPGVDVRINNPDPEGNGEICWKGRSSFLGYMYNEKETAETFDPQGWLHTGDIGRLDKDGYLYITGRIKELIITAGGENIPPSIIEDEMKLHLGDLVSNIMVVGDKRKFLACLITLKTDPIADPAEGQYSLTDNLSKDALGVVHGIGSSAKTVQEAKNDQALKKWIFDAIGRYNKNSHSAAQQVRAFAILDQDFTVDNELLTPTMKLKRRVVATRYAKEIDEMYIAAEKEFEGAAK